MQRVSDAARSSHSAYRTQSLLPCVPPFALDSVFGGRTLACRLVLHDETRSRRFPSADDVLVVPRVGRSVSDAQLVQLCAPETKADYLLGVGLAVIAPGGLKIVVGEWSCRRMVGIKQSPTPILSYKQLST